MMGARQRPPCVGLRIALIIVIKFLGGGHVQQAFVSLSIGNDPLYPEDKLTQASPHKPLPRNDMDTRAKLVAKKC